jgi:MtN3 and saliva related transmembrane protein
MDKVTLIGTVAAILTTISFFPQVYKIYRTKHVHDLSLPMYIIFSTGVFLWFVYGLTIRSMPVILANGITFVSCLYILAMIIKYK